MNDRLFEQPPRFHAPILHCQRHNFPEHERLDEDWERYVPQERAFCLCARFAQGMSELIQVGDLVGQPKAKSPRVLQPKAAKQVLTIISAQASIEFGLIQQHYQTLDRAQDDRTRAWVLRVMAEELRHGYQMITLITGADWSPVMD